MPTRREVLTGAAAASIAAIASSRGVAVADVGCGNVAGGALAAFHKEPDAFGVFLKLEHASAEVFYKSTASGPVQVFFKFFNKFSGWTPVTSIPLQLTTLDGAVAGFLKIDTQGAQFFIKGDNGARITTTIQSGEGGLQLNTEEFTLPT